MLRDYRLKGEEDLIYALMQASAGGFDRYKVGNVIQNNNGRFWGVNVKPPDVVECFVWEAQGERQRFGCIVAMNPNPNVVKGYLTEWSRSVAAALPATWQQGETSEGFQGIPGNNYFGPNGSRASLLISQINGQYALQLDVQRGIPESRDGR